MTCQSSKFILVSILTFLVSIGIVQVWQGFTSQVNLESKPQTVQNKADFSNYQPLKIDFCEELKKNPNYLNVEPTQIHHMVSGGILNQRVCDPLPYRDIDLKSRDWTKDYVMVNVTVDENGFVISASTITKPKFGKKFEKIAKGLRVRPTVINGMHVKCIGVLIFYPNENYSDR